VNLDQNPGHKKAYNEENFVLYIKLEAFPVTMNPNVADPDPNPDP
jgi:hypothetical protein